jgi:signal transduction histidine kinase
MKTATELRSIVGFLTALIIVGTLASAGSLIVITSYLHRLTTQIDANLQSVRAAEEIQLQLLRHARNVNQASLMNAPFLAEAAEEARLGVLRWLNTAKAYIGSNDEAAILAKLETELDVYFSEQAELASAGLPALERYAEAAALFEAADDLAEQLLDVNVAQASDATRQAATWDRIATGIGLAVAAASLVLTAGLILGARRSVYRPLLGLVEAIRRYAARDYAARAGETGPTEIRAIARSFNDMAEQLERQRSQQLAFVAFVAHELRNPLAAMKAAIQAIAATNERAIRAPSNLTTLLSRQIDLLARMLSDLLDSARIESGQLVLATAEEDARDLVLGAVALFRQVAPIHELTVQVPDTPLPVLCDAARMTQVINNLLSNAIKYSPLGGRIDARALDVNGGVVIEISDEGIGIAEQECAMIFEPFRRAKTTGWAIPGVGIGLSVSRRIVEAHGGTITVRSVVGAGSTFTVWIPCQRHHRTPPRASEREPQRVRKVPAAVLGADLQQSASASDDTQPRLNS